MKRLGLKYGRVSQEILVNKKSGCPSHTTQLHTAYYWPINYATAAACPRNVWSVTLLLKKKGPSAQWTSP